MNKTITIDGRSVTFKATAATPRKYRQSTGRDLLVDMQMLMIKYQQMLAERKDPNLPEKERHELSSEELTIFEEAAFTMAKQADPENTPDSADDWLDTFEMFSIWMILPEILELWRLNQASTSNPKK